jgi:hypothetical protein
MIQGINDLFITGSAHADRPPHPDRTGDAPHRRGDPTSPRKRGEVNPLKLVRETSKSRHSVSARSSNAPSVCCESQYFPGTALRLRRGGVGGGGRGSESESRARGEAKLPRVNVRIQSLFGRHRSPGQSGDTPLKLQPSALVHSSLASSVASVVRFARRNL